MARQPSIGVLFRVLLKCKGQRREKIPHRQGETLNEGSRIPIIGGAEDGAWKNEGAQIAVIAT
jgi:hypothetical protein